MTDGPQMNRARSIQRGEKCLNTDVWERKWYTDYGVWPQDWGK